jgi:hypothetical protein
MERRAEQLGRHIRRLGNASLLSVALAACIQDQAGQPALDALPIASLELANSCAEIRDRHPASDSESSFAGTSEQKT